MSAEEHEDFWIRGSSFYSAGVALQTALLASLYFIYRARKTHHICTYIPHDKLLLCIIKTNNTLLCDSPLHLSSAFFCLYSVKKKVDCVAWLP